MTEFQALVLGLIQGLSEFLPISSSAHLALTPWFFGWESGGLAFDVALHIGTLVAVAWYFRREWVALTKSGISIVRQRGVKTTDEWRLVFLIVATIPAAIAGLTLEDLAETTFRSPKLCFDTKRNKTEIASQLLTAAAAIPMKIVDVSVPGVNASGALSIAAARVTGKLIRKLNTAAA